jgi:hypothetical protein
MAGDERVVADEAHLVHRRPVQHLRRVVLEAEPRIQRLLDEERVVALAIAADQLVALLLAERDERLEARAVVRRGLHRLI